MLRAHTYGNRPPNRGETCAVLRTDQTKRSALLFDRIYVNSRSEVKFDIPVEVTFAIEEADDYIERLVGERKAAFENESNRNPPAGFGEYITEFQTFLDRSILQAYSEHRIEVIPVYNKNAEFRKVFPAGQAIVWQSAFDNLPIVDEESISWDQVLEFRKDKESVRKYRDLRIWLRDGLKAKSVSEATDIVAQKIDDYEWAMRTHGFKTITGALSAIFDWQGLSIAGATALATFIIDPTAAAAVGGLTIAGKVFVWLAQRDIEREEVSRDKNREVAYIYEARKRFD